MALSESQDRDINLAYKAINISITNMKKGLKDAVPRLQKLAEAGFHVERLMVNAQLLEHALKGVIRVFQLKRTVWGVLGLPDPLNNKEIPLFEKKELGVVIEIFSRLNDDATLTANLTDFKNRFRNDYIHHIFDGTHDLEQADRDAEAYLSSEDFSSKILVQVLTVHLRLQKEIAEEVERHERS